MLYFQFNMNNIPIIPEPIYLHYLSALLDGDKGTCKSVVTNLLSEKLDVKIIYKDLIERSMYRVGALWDRCRISIADEHAATQISLEILGLINSQSHIKPATGRSIIITCVQKEYHDLGARLVSDFLEFRGWNSTFLGSNIPVKDFVKLVHDKKPDLVGLSNNFYLNVGRLFDFIDNIKTKSPDQKIIIGGQGPKNCYSEIISKYCDIRYLNSLDEVDNYLIENFDSN